MEIFKNTKVSVILYYSKNLPYGLDGFERILKTIKEQTIPPEEIIVIDLDERDGTNLNNEDLRIIRGFNLEAEALSEAIEGSSGDYIIYIDNKKYEVLLKRSFIETALMANIRNDNLGMLYTDYEMDTGKSIQEKHLLKHHLGRVRDNQDYGYVLFFPSSVLEKNMCDPLIKYKPIYDIRLRVSEKYDLVHIADRFEGALYKVIASETKDNVFDYLMDSKESQVEAERIITEHLKRIGAYLEPGEYYKKRELNESELLATVIIPVYKRPEFINNALESVFRQTIQKIEVIVIVNGGETDPTIDEVKKYMPNGKKYDPHKPAVRLKVVDVNNIGLCLNIGARLARGKYYIQLDSDDRLKSNAVEKVINKFESDAKIGMVIGSYEVWELSDSGKLIRMKEIPVVTHDEWTQENGRNNLLRINGAGAPRCIPFDIIKEMDFFDMNDMPYARNYGEDYDMVLKISEKYKIGRIYDPIYEVVRHSGGTDHNIDQQTTNRNNEAKDHMRLKCIQRRIKLNKNK